MDSGEARGVRARGWEGKGRGYKHLQRHRLWEVEFALENLPVRPHRGLAAVGRRARLVAVATKGVGRQAGQRTSRQNRSEQEREQEQIGVGKDTASRSSLRAGQVLSVRCRGVAYEHLIDQNAEGPPVDALAVALVADGLGREVLGRAAQRPRAVLDLLRKAKVDDLLMRKVEEWVGVREEGG